MINVRVSNAILNNDIAAVLQAVQKGSCSHPPSPAEYFSPARPPSARHSISQDAPFLKRGRSERRGESYSLLYGEPLSDARTQLAVFFNSR
jgi:hypothetical protein